MIGPVYDLLSEEFENVVFIKVDVDENAETAAKYDVSAMPTFVFIKVRDFCLGGGRGKEMGGRRTRRAEACRVLWEGFTNKQSPYNPLS